MNVVIDSFQDLTKEKKRPSKEKESEINKNKETGIAYRWLNEWMDKNLEFDHNSVIFFSDLYRNYQAFVISKLAENQILINTPTATAIEFIESLSNSHSLKVFILQENIVAFCLFFYFLSLKNQEIQRKRLRKGKVYLGIKLKT